MKRCVRLAGVLAVVGGLGLARVGEAAQPERPRPARRERPERREEPPPLRGPEVRDEQPPGPGAGLIGGGGDQRIGERIPLRVFLAAVRALDGEGMDELVRLTDEQRRLLREYGDEFQRQRREYMERHAGELRELRAAAGEGQRRRGGEPGGRNTEMGEEEGRREGGGRRAPQGGEPAGDRGAALERLREIERGAPQPEELYKRVWAELRPEQREVVERELDRFRAERAREREEAYVRRRVPESERRDAPARREPRGEAAGVGERRERLLRAFERLSPEEQEQLLMRLEERLRERRPGGRPPRGDRPPPRMDEVDVPEEPGPVPDR